MTNDVIASGACVIITTVFPSSFHFSQRLVPNFANQFIPEIQEIASGMFGIVEGANRRGRAKREDIVEWFDI